MDRELLITKHASHGVILHLLSNEEASSARVRLFALTLSKRGVIRLRSLAPSTLDGFDSLILTLSSDDITLRQNRSLTSTPSLYQQRLSHRGSLASNSSPTLLAPTNLSSPCHPPTTKKPARPACNIMLGRNAPTPACYAGNTTTECHAVLRPKDHRRKGSTRSETKRSGGSR